MGSLRVTCAAQVAARAFPGCRVKMEHVNKLVTRARPGLTAFAGRSSVSLQTDVSVHQSRFSVYCCVSECCVSTVSLLQSFRLFVFVSVSTCLILFGSSVDK